MKVLTFGFNFLATVCICSINLGFGQELFKGTEARQDKTIKDSIYLNQIDFRNRASFSFSLPGVRLRFRPFYEYRYKPRKLLKEDQNIN